MCIETMDFDAVLKVIESDWMAYEKIGGFDETKYPEEVYCSLRQPDVIDELWIKKSLVWKYGKWAQYYLRHSQIPTTHEKAIAKFINNISVLKKLKEEKNYSDCEHILKPLPQISSIFISHLLFPDHWAIVDQHNARYYLSKLESLINEYQCGSYLLS